MKSINRIIFIIIIIFVLIGFILFRLYGERKNAETNVVLTELANELDALDEERTSVPEMDRAELFGDYYEEAKKIVSKMTVEERASQMFLVRFPDTGVEDEIKENNPGGYILFGRDFENETKNSITKKLNEYQANSKLKMFFGVDEEGGTVTRVSRYTQFRNEKFKSPQALYEEGGLDRIIEDSHEKTGLLKSLGLNLNLVPVADITENSNSFIYDRTLGQGAEETAKYTKELIKAMNEDKMLSVIKHFPGYGDNVDTHTGIAVDEREYSSFEETDFLPFISGIEESAPMILVNHNIVNCMDSNMPASLSKNVHDILRDKLNFSGLIMTDDLAMDAVKQYVENGEAAVQAVLAGNDVIISSDFANQKKEIVDAVKRGTIPEDVIAKACIRIVACKLKYEII